MEHAVNVQSEAFTENNKNLSRTQIKHVNQNSENNNSFETCEILQKETGVSAEVSTSNYAEDVELDTFNAHHFEIKLNNEINNSNIAKNISMREKSAQVMCDEMDRVKNSLDILSEDFGDAFQKSSKNTVLVDSDSDEGTDLVEKVKKANLKQVRNSNLRPLITVSKKHKIPNILDSDSDSESSINKGLSNITTENEDNEFMPVKNTKIHKLRTFVDTDSESEGEREDILHHKSFNSCAAETLPTLSSCSVNVSNIPSREVISNIYKGSDETTKNGKVLNTDSEPGGISPHDGIFNSSIDNSKSTEEKMENTILEGKIGPYTETSKQKSRLVMLCDSDSEEAVSDKEGSLITVSDDEIIEESQHAEKLKSGTKSSKTTTSSIKKTKRKNPDTEIAKKMTPKEVAELRKEIQSESQRMIREKNVCLPYHKPKAHSLTEFLARRPRLTVTVPVSGSAPPSVAIKMSNEQLKIISKKLNEREKEVKEFYKSESDSENGDDIGYVPSTSGINQTDIDGKKTTNITVNRKIVHEDKCPEETSEAEPLVLEYDKEQTSDNLQNDVDDFRNSVQSGIEEKETTDETRKYVPMETSDTSQAEEYKTNIDEHKKLEESSPNYDFHLNDENSEQSFSTNNTQDNQQAYRVDDSLEISEPEKEPALKPFNYTDLDMEIENFGNSGNEHDLTEESSSNQLPSPSVKSKLAILKESQSSKIPKLSGGPDEIIDLNSAVAQPKEVVELMERFAKHATSKKQDSRHRVKLSIVTVESGGDIHKETVAVNVDNDNEVIVKVEKPGAKLQRLREELQKQIDQRKSEVWQKKAAKGLRGSEETNEGENHNEEGEKDILSNDEEEEEAEMTDEDDSEEEIESNIELSDKPLKKCGFLDLEAEESGEDTFSHKDGFEGNVLNEEKNGESEHNESENDEEDHEDTNMSNGSPASKLPETEHQTAVGTKRVLKRIIKPDDDSDEEDLFAGFISQNPTDNNQLDSTVTADEDDIPPHQPRQLQTPIRQAISQTKSISDFLTPISFITSIQNLTSATKGNKYGPIISPFRMPQELSPSEDGTSGVLQKNLFAESEVMDCQGSLDIQIIQTQKSSSDIGQDNESMSLQGTQLENKDESPNTQDLMGICSGEFTGVTQLEPSDNTRKLIDDGSQSSDLKSLGTDQDMIISQLLDEEELENFKKKFESPVNSVTQRSFNDKTQELTGGGIIDSDEECGLKKKKYQRRIQFSDDESSEDETDGSEEEIDLQDKGEVDGEKIDHIGYDSEENEIDLKNIGREEKMKMADFLDAEAELSESEWGSEDEDENDLDKLEFELGDTEKFDEEQVKEDLEKIHMRRMLDDDAREVKLLQEVLLEDGEMHGTRRQRQFKWKNLDVNDDQTEETKDNDEIYLDEEESEELWRKTRHEREMFLKEEQRKSQTLKFGGNDLLNHSQLLKTGQKVLQKSQNNSQNSIAKSEPDSPICKTPLSFLSRRGSFLSRGDQVLQRVAEYTNITTDVSSNSSKTTKNFLFQSVSVSEVASEENKKRRASEGTPKVIKKLRLDTNRSPAVKNMLSSKKSKKLFNI